MADHHDAGTPGGVDDTVAVQDALDTVRSTGTRRVYFGPGDWVVQGRIDIDGHRGTILYGSHATRFRWKGNATDPMFHLAGSREVEIREVVLTPFSESYPLATAILMEQDGLPGSGASSMNRFHRLHIDGIGVMAQGIHLKGSGTDANNDFSAFNECYISGYDEAAVVIQGANCLSNHFRNCQLAGGRNGRYGIKSIQGAGAQAGHFNMTGGAVLGHLQSDFYLETRCALPIVVDNVWSEGSERCFLTGGPNGAMCGISLRDVQWASDRKSQSYEVIDIRMPGPVELHGCLFGTEYTKAIKIKWSYTRGYFAPSFRVIGCRVLGSLRSGAAIFNGTMPSRRMESYWQTSDTASGEL
jgi:hypothetical protein